VGLVLLVAAVAAVLALAVGGWAVVTAALGLRRAAKPLVAAVNEASPKLQAKAAAASAAAARLRARGDRLATGKAELAASVASGRRTSAYVAEALAPLQQLRDLR
jgi:hypothetical protein